jgi:hypothetical protein
VLVAPWAFFISIKDAYFLHIKNGKIRQNADNIAAACYI